MKKADFKIEELQFAFSKYFFWKERIYFDEKQVSARFSFGGTRHAFNIGNDHFQVKSSYKSFGLKNIDLKFKKNGKRMNSVTVAMKNVLIAEMIMGVFIGVAFYQLINYSIQYL